MKNTATFVLIHGAWHGAWCFYKLKPLLEQAGHRVITFDLPALGQDRSDPATVTLQDHAAAVVSVLDSLDAPAIVVGHSYGGVLLSQACAERPSKVRKAVYLAGFMLQDGQSLLDVAGADTASAVTQNIVLNGVPPEDGVVQVAEDARAAAFYGDCSAEDVRLALSLITPQPFLPFATPVQLNEHYHRVPKTYITCLQDRAITADAQKAMYGQFPDTKVIPLQTSHSPFLSAPAALATILLQELAP